VSKNPEQHHSEPHHPEPHEPQPQPSIIQPIIDDLKGKNPTQQPTEDETAPPRGPLHPPQPASPQPAELDQDPGGGYNPDGTYPQT
jgi:hypothetical protein